MDSPYLFYGFIILFILILAMEVLKPNRRDRDSVAIRSTFNIMLYIAGMLIILVIPYTLIELLDYIENYQVGLLNLFEINLVVSIIFTVIIIDLIFYSVHRLAHKYKYLWLIHKMHHSDIDIDVTSNFRHNPLEILINSMIFYVVVFVFGLPVEGLLFSLVINTSISLFSHCNVKMNVRFEKIVNIIFVTPAYHVIHHSSVSKYTDSNFGNIFSVWDRLFKTNTNIHEDFDDTKLGLDDSIQLDRIKNVLTLKKLKRFV